MDSSVEGGTIDFTLTNGRIDKQRNRDLANQHGNIWVVSTREEVDRQTSFPHAQPGVSHHINDNYHVSVPVCRWLTRGKQTLKRVHLNQPHRNLVSASPD